MDKEEHINGGSIQRRQCHGFRKITRECAEVQQRINGKRPMMNGQIRGKGSCWISCLSGKPRQPYLVAARSQLWVIMEFGRLIKKPAEMHQEVNEDRPIVEDGNQESSGEEPHRIPLSSQR